MTACNVSNPSSIEVYSLEVPVSLTLTAILLVAIPATDEEITFPQARSLSPASQPGQQPATQMPSRQPRSLQRPPKQPRCLQKPPNAPRKPLNASWMPPRCLRMPPRPPKTMFSLIKTRVFEVSTKPLLEVFCVLFGHPGSPFGYPKAARSFPKDTQSLQKAPQGYQNGG